MDAVNQILFRISFRHESLNVILLVFCECLSAILNKEAFPVAILESY